MTIASQIQDYADGLTASYNMVSQRGGTIPQRKNMQNLSTAIATIPSGGSPVFPMPMTTVVNGKVQKDSYAQSYALPSNITDVGDGVFSYATSNMFSFYVTSYDFSSLTAVSGYGAFQNAFTSISPYSDPASFDFSNVVTISGSEAFQWAFAYSYGTPGNYTVDFSSLTTITGSGAFNGAFQSNETIQSISFPSLSNLGNYTNQFDDMLDNCSDVTVHFPAALQSVIGNWTSVQNGFGGTNTTVLFDL